jgi:hypothetical protein
MLFVSFRCIYAFTLSLVCLTFCCSQEQMDSVASKKKDALRIYIDCGSCDIDYLRTTITFVNYVRDRADAQVHILVTTQETGSGGREYTITFIGRQNFEGIDDTLKYISKQSDTEDIIRTGIARTMKLGLMRYVSKTPLGEKITIDYSEPSQPTAVVDPWDFWVFRTNVNGFFNGQSSTNSSNIYFSLSANRVTPDIKIDISLNGSYGENNYDAGTVVYSSFSRSRGMRASVVLSISDHWSAGGFTAANSSTYSNEKLSWGFGPAIEYNIYPYDESTRRQLRLGYSLEYKYRTYEEETIFFKTNEQLYREKIEAALELKEQWGTIEVSASASHYFHDFNKYNLNADGSISLKLVEGLSLRLYGNASKVRDQLSLPRSGATAEEVLTRQKELATQYFYWASVGFSYTFGSIYNNVVNPRFGD